MICNKMWAGICLAGMALLLAACNVGERIAEVAVEEAIEQVAGEGALATSEAFTGAVATEVAVLATQESGGETGEESAESKEMREERKRIEK